ncbi:hypothetical protein [Sphingobacterium hotanense]|uniref:hypothetical protein n=1 Tax=Sphingobacterium hotanense TaxID=649196 RepID=UPI0011F149B5|nr:hypothetical protein [Sphingobacterium hotanense]
MFFSVGQHEEAAFAVDQLVNPVNAGNPMVLSFVRTYSSTAFFKATSKDAAPFYVDTVTNKRISKKNWTEGMHNVARLKESLVPAAPYRFKITIFGYIMLLAVIGFFAYLTYDSFFKPVNPNINAAQPLEQTMEPNNIYFGRFERYEEGQRIPSKTGFGWFKVTENANGTVKLAMSKDMQTHHQAPANMNSTDFEETTAEMKIEEQESYNIRLKSTDGLLEVNLTEKK